MLEGMQTKQGIINGRAHSNMFSHVADPFRSGCPKDILHEPLIIDITDKNKDALLTMFLIKQHQTALLGVSTASNDC